MVDKIRDYGVAYDVMSFATPTILAYMALFDEPRFDFYKIHKNKRAKLLEFSLAMKKIDPFIFIRKTINTLRNIIDDAKDSEEELCVVIPDCRYWYEIDQIFDTGLIDHFYCINVIRNVDGVEDYADREHQFMPPDKQIFTTVTKGLWIDFENDSSIDSLEPKVDTFFKQLELINAK